MLHWHCIQIFTNTWNHSVCMSFCLSVQNRVWPIRFFWFDIGLPYVAHGCITIRQCVTYIHDPESTLTFDLEVKFIGIFTCFRVRPISFYWFDIDLPYLAHGCISIHERMCRVRSWSRRISLVAQKYVDALPCFSNDIHATISINCKSISFLFECNIAILCKTSLSVEMHCSVYFRETRFC